MPTLLFPERNSLRQALADGGVAPAVFRTPATTGFDDQGRLWLTTSAWLPRETLVALAQFGIQVFGSSAVPTSSAMQCWQELIPLEPVPAAPENFAGTVIFSLAGGQLPSVAGEIERLGRQPWSYRWQHEPGDDSGDDRLFLKTVAPPYCSMLRVLGPATEPHGMQAFVEQAPGVWVVAGWRHPLAGQIQPPAGKLLLLRPPRAWELNDDRPFATAVDFTNPRAAGSAGLATSALANQAVSAPLRLVAGDDDDPAELWVVRDDALAWLDRFVQGLDGAILGRFSIAVSGGAGRSFVLLRIMAGKEPPPVLVGLPAGYRPLLKLANLFVPSGRRLAPLPRRDTLRQLLAADPERLTWLSPLEDGRFATESLPLTSFRPLAAWVDYRIEQPIEAHAAWAQTTAHGLDFARFVEEREPRPSRQAAEAPAAERPGEPARAAVSSGTAGQPARRGWFARTLGWLTGARSRPRPALPETFEEPAAIPMEQAVETAWRFARERTLAPPAKVSEVLERCKALESRCLSTLGRLTSGDRLELWPELASAYAQSGNFAEGAICWLNALWEQDELSPLWAWGWLRAEAAQAHWNPDGVKIADWLAAPPTPARARAVAAYAVWATRQAPSPPGFRANLNQLQVYLDRHEEHLPLRGAWLARTALVRESSGDVLALARTRDRLFERLHRGGLSLDIDAPAFIRFAESGDPDRFNRVRKWLTDKRRLIQNWIEQLGPPKADGEPRRIALDQFGLQAEVRCTRAYADLMLAWALVRLGEKNQGAALRDEACKNLDGNDPIHAFLRDAFDYRIGQAREAMSAGGPLPAGLLARLDVLPADDRYRIDRFREHSRLLDPSERINAYWASTMRHFQHWGQLRKQLVDLPALDTAALNERVRKLLNHAGGAAPADLPVVLLEVLDSVGRFDPQLAEKALRALPTALDLVAETPRLQRRLLEKGLLAAALFDRPALVQPLTRRLVEYVENRRGLPASTIFEGLTGETFRCLRRLGLKRDAAEILGRIHVLLTDGGEDLAVLRKKRPNEWPGLLRTLLPVAAAYYCSGQEDRGHEIINMAPYDLYYGSMPLTERTALALGYAATLGHIPVRLALERYANLFRDLKKISVNGWNTHYTLQPLQLIDTVVLAIVSEEFTLGPAVRAWLDDDEYLVRQRIHMELKELMDKQGV